VVRVFAENSRPPPLAPEKAPVPAVTWNVVSMRRPVVAQSSCCEETEIVPLSKVNVSDSVTMLQLPPGEVYLQVRVIRPEAGGEVARRRAVDSDVCQRAHRRVQARERRELRRGVLRWTGCVSARAAGAATAHTSVKTAVKPRMECRT